MALNFTAASAQRVTGTPAIDLSGATNSTLFFSGRRASTGTYQGVGYDKGAAGGNDRWIISWFTDNKLYALVESPNQGFVVTAADTGTGAYNHCGTYDGNNSNAALRVKLFKNGVAQSVTYNPTVGATLPSSIGIFYIGYSQVDNAYSTGNISEVAIWNVTLTDAEISSLGKGFKPSRIRPQSLAFYTPLIRNAQDLRGGVTLTVSNSPPAAAHPRVY